MMFRISGLLLLTGGFAVLGCQNPKEYTSKFGKREGLETRFRVASDDPGQLESGRGHLPSLASEMADHRRGTEDQSPPGIPGGSSLTVKRLLERGQDADAHGRTQEARMYYQQVLTEAPDQPDAHHRLAILADQAGEYQLAERHYQMALRGKPNNADVLNDLGYSYFLQGRAADSKHYLQQALDLNPRHPHVQENLSLLSNPAKAEKVLLAAMGPRQSQVTLARLFQNDSQPDRQDDFNRFNSRLQQQLAQRSQEQDRARNSGEPDTIETLQQKMEQARMKSIAERRQRMSPGRQMPNPQGQNYPSQLPPQVPSHMAGMPQLPPQYPFHPHSQPGNGPILELPAGQINNAFRNIDGGGHSQNRQPGLVANRSLQVPNHYDPRMNPPQWNAPRGIAPPPSQHSQDNRASAPTWNTPPQHWPQVPPHAVSQSSIEQTNHAQPAMRHDLPSAAKRAAEIGMAAGPGAMFPTLEDSPAANGFPNGPLPAARSLPGTHSRMNGSQYQQPSTSGVPSNWDSHSAPANLQAGYQETPYDQMRSRHNAQSNFDQRQLAGREGLMSNGPPAAAPLPSTFDPNRQDWPAYSREQYDTRQMDVPPTPQNQPQYSGQFEGQQVPQYNPANQQAPQNYGRRW